MTQNKDISYGQSQTGFLPHSKIHGADGEQREGMHFDHDGHEGHIQQHLNET